MLSLILSQSVSFSSILTYSAIFLAVYSIYRLYDYLVLRPRRFHSYWASQGLKIGDNHALLGTFGEMHSAAEEFKQVEHSLSCTARYGLAYPVQLGPFCFVAINDPELIKLIFTRHANCYLKSDEDSKSMLRIYLLNGLLLSEGDHWKKERKLLTPAFHFQSLKEMVPMMVGAVETAINKWLRVVESGKGREEVQEKEKKYLTVNGTKIPVPPLPPLKYHAQPQPSVEVEICHEFAAITLDTIATALFGSEFHEDEDKQHLFISTSRYILDLQNERTMNLIGYIPYLKDFPLKSLRELKAASRIIHSLIAEIIEQRRRGLSHAVGGREDLLDRMLAMRANQGEDNDNSMTDRNILEESVNFISAGAETTSNLLSWLVYRAVTEPGVWDSMVEEVDRVLGDESVMPSADKLKELKYIESVIFEALRLHAPATNIFKLAYKEHELGPLKVPKDTVVIIQAHVVHRLAQYWPEPEKFKPERFLNAEFDLDQESSAAPKGQQHPFQFIGFSAGPRKCLGKNFAIMELKVILARLVQRVQFELVPGQRIVPDPMSFQAKFGIHMKIRKRTQPVVVKADNVAADNRRIIKPVGII